MLYFLVGFMGAGKTTVGKLLAERLAVPFVDSDKEIEKQTGLLVKQIFDTYGEAYFRKLEAEFIESISPQNAVISCGGGLPCYNSQMEKLLEKGQVVYLEAQVPTLLERLKNEIAERPLLAAQDLEKSVSERLSVRENCYSKASVTVKTDSATPDQVVEIILSRRSSINA